MKEKTILITEDNEPALAVMKDILQKNGFVVDTASTFIEASQKINSSKKYDFILVDTWYDKEQKLCTKRSDFLTERGANEKTLFIIEGFPTSNTSHLDRLFTLYTPQEEQKYVSKRELDTMSEQEVYFLDACYLGEAKAKTALKVISKRNQEMGL